MTRDELILRTRQLIAEGDRLAAQPSLAALQTWLQLSDDLLATAWGTMDRYHLSWLMVGKPAETIRGREMTPHEAAAYVREVAAQKTAALRMSLDAVERQGMPFRGETGGVGPGQGMGEVPHAEAGEATVGPRADLEPGEAQSGTARQDEAEQDEAEPGEAEAREPISAANRRAIPLDPRLQQRLDEARRAAAAHSDHDPSAPRRAPRPERLQR